MIHVKEFNDPASLGELAPTWRRLLAQTPIATFFHSCDWLETYWQHFGGDQKLRVFVVRQGKQVTGIVPMTVLREPTKLGAVRVLTYPQAYWGSYYGPIGPAPRESLRAVLGRLRRSRRDWDLLDLRFAPPTELDPARTDDELCAAGFAADERETDRTSIIDLPSSFDAYMAQRPSKWRNNHRRWLRRLKERGNLRFVRHRPLGASHGDADPRWDLYDACEAVALKSWQGSSTTGTTITHPTIRPFVRDMHVTACNAGAADVSMLLLDEQPIAFLYGYRYRGHVYGLRVGYDESVSRDGVGNILYTSVVEDSIAQGDRVIDLGPGSLEAKRALISRIVPIFRRTYGNPYSWRGLLWRAKRAWDARRSGTAPAVEAAAEDWATTDQASAADHALPAGEKYAAAST
jgi:CelD/BcsL family acetyltransferase involved in cellulose biosynthesis